MQFLNLHNDANLKLQNVPLMINNFSVGNDVEETVVTFTWLMLHNQGHSFYKRKLDNKLQPTVMCLHLSLRSIAIKNATTEKLLEICTTHIMYSKVSPFIQSKYCLNWKMSVVISSHHVAIIQLLNDYIILEMTMLWCNSKILLNIF